MNVQNPGPNQYELKGKGVKILYSPTSFSGEPRFTYQHHAQSLNFSGGQIRSLETELGRLITVTLESTPDLKEVTFTLLLPVVNLSQGETEHTLKTVGIRTTSHTTIGGPGLVNGAVQTYETLQLSGKAKIVEFFSQTTA